MSEKSRISSFLEPAIEGFYFSLKFENFLCRKLLALQLSQWIIEYPQALWDKKVLKLYIKNNIIWFLNICIKMLKLLTGKKKTQNKVQDIL